MSTLVQDISTDYIVPFSSLTERGVNAAKTYKTAAEFHLSSSLDLLAIYAFKPLGGGKCGINFKLRTPRFEHELPNGKPITVESTVVTLSYTLTIPNNLKSKILEQMVNGDTKIDAQHETTFTSKELSALADLLPTNRLRDVLSSDDYNKAINAYDSEQNIKNHLLSGIWNSLDSHTFNAIIIFSADNVGDVDISKYEETLLNVVSDNLPMVGGQDAVGELMLPNKRKLAVTVTSPVGSTNQSVALDYSEKDLVIRVTTTESVNVTLTHPINVNLRKSRNPNAKPFVGKIHIKRQYAIPPKAVQQALTSGKREIVSTSGHVVNGNMKFDGSFDMQAFKKDMPLSTQAQNFKVGLVIK